MDQDYDPDDAMVEAAVGNPPPPIDPSLFGQPLRFSSDPRPAPDPDPEPVGPVVEEEPTEEFVPQEFDPRHREAFTGLLWVGYLSRRFQIYGHDFLIATPTSTERMQIGLVMRDYTDTFAQEIAYATALVAAFLVSIDGVELPKPVTTNSKETALHDRFRWVSENMRRPVVNRIFGECMELEEEVEGALDAMGKA
jgi:hypothetical protein